MFSLVYVSSAARAFSRDELVALLIKARANNTALGVTGMLLYKGGNFMQVLEGDEQVVKDLQHKIAVDGRHHGMLILLQQHQADREFDGWSMAFRDLAHDGGEKIEGHSDFMSLDWTDPLFTSDISKIQRLLRTFRRSMG
jgi:hypothetical protein